MKKLLELLGIVLLTSNAAGALVANKPNNNKAKIKNSLETLTRQKRQAPKKQGKGKNKNDNPPTTPKPQTASPSTSTTDSQTDIIEKEINLDGNYAESIQKMLQELIDEKYLDPLRSINMGGLISNELDNGTIISKLEKLEPKMADWIKEQKNNKEKVLILTLKNSNNQSIKLVINLKDFYVQGFINKDEHVKEQYFYFKDSKVKEIKDKNLNIQESINLGCDSNYSHLITESDFKISYHNINDSIIILSKHTEEKNKYIKDEIKKLKSALVRLIFITSEAMRFQCDEESLQIYVNIKNIDELKKVISESKNILAGIQEKVFKDKDEINWSDYKEQINNWSKYSEKINEFRIEIWKQLIKDKKEAKNFIYFSFKNKEKIINLLTESLKIKDDEKKVTEETKKLFDSISEENEKKLKDTFVNFITYQVINVKKNDIEKNIDNFGKLNIDDIDDVYFFCILIIQNNLDIIKLLIKIKWNENLNFLKYHEWTGLIPLNLAPAVEGGGQLEIVKFLLENDADVNIQSIEGRAPLHYAACNVHLKVVKELLENGAKVNITDNDGNTPLHLAAVKGHTEIVKLLLAGGAKVNIKAKDGKTPLHYALIYGHTDIAKLLLHKGADINIKNNENRTSLYYAVFYGHLDVVSLAKGAKVNIKDRIGVTPLHLAAVRGFLAIAKLLLDKGAYVNIKAKDGKTPLHYAVNSPRVNLEIVEKLLAAKDAKVNIKDNEGFTPLHYAVYNGELDVVKLLLANGADVNTTNKDGDSLLHTATKNKFDKAKELLENFIQLKQELITSESKNKIKHIEESIKKLLKIELSDVITKTELGEISDNQEQTILNRVKELNYNLDINQVKVQENSITDTAATIESIDQSVYPGTVTFTFTLAKKLSNPNDSQKIITEDKYQKATIASSPTGTGGTQNKNTKTTNKNNLYDVPADGSCLFWSIATSYLVPVRNNNEEFRNRFIQLFGELQLSYLSYVQTLLQQFDLSNTNNFLQAWYQDATAHRLVRVVFRNRVVDYIERNLDNPTQRNTNRDGELTFRSLIQENNEIASNYLARMRQSPTWGGTPEILAMSNLINTNINVNTSVNYNDYYQPINPNSNNNNIAISYVELEKGSGIHNHYNFALTPEEDQTNRPIAINGNQTIVSIISNTNSQEKTIAPLQKDEYHFLDKKTEEKSLKNDENLEINLIKNNNKIKQNVPVVNKSINKNIINAQITATKAINKYNALSKEEKLKKLNEINRYYQTLSENDKKAFKEKLTNTGLAALSGGALTAYGTKMTVSGTAATSVINAEAMEMTPLLSTSTTESLAAAETITVAETAAIEGGVIAGETGTAAALAPETLGLSLVIGGLAIAGTWMYFAFHHHATSDIVLPASIHHNVYDNIEKWYKFLAHDKLKIKINKNIWNEIKQNKNSQANITKIIKNKFIISDHSGWGGSVTNEDFNTLVKVILLHFEQINGYFEILDNENDGFVIITNTEGDWLGIE